MWIRFCRGVSGALPAAAASAPLLSSRNRHPTGCSAADAPTWRLTRIEASTLIPGRGPPIKDGVVVFEGRQIRYAGHRATAPTTPGAEVFRGEAVLPGMWDCHTHFIGCADKHGPIFDELLKTSGTERAMRCVGHAAKLLDAGFTSVREVGGIGYAVAAAIEDGSIRGPHVYYAGDILSTTGGHGDMHEVPLECYQACSHMVGHLCDGVPECLKAVRLQLRKGAHLIKICASGGVMSKVDHPMHQQFSDEELTAIVEEARRAEVVVAAHCHGKAGIMAALRAGVHTIEHGSYVDEEAIDLMISKGAILVPTRYIIESLKAIVGDRKVGDPPPPSLTQWQMDKLVGIYHEHKANIGLAIRKGVQVAVGCDLFVAREIGYNGKELAYLVDLGMTPLQAIEAATANGPATLGPQAPKAGLLASGYDADILLVSKNPLEDIATLGDPQSVTHVWKHGALVKPVVRASGPAGRAYASWDQAGQARPPP